MSVMMNITFEDTNVIISKTQILSNASDCSNDIDLPPKLLFLFLSTAFILKQQQQSLTFQSQQ
jgi:hypothetical protein